MFKPAEELVNLRQHYRRNGYADGNSENGFVFASPCGQQMLRFVRRSAFPGSVGQSCASIFVHGKPQKMRTSI
jgi:hypothetical protein